LPIYAYTNDYLLCKRKNCKAKHIKQWFYLFIDQHNIENCYLKLTAPLKLTEPLCIIKFILNYIIVISKQ
jgi:hypothetical protein